MTTATRRPPDGERLARLEVKVEFLEKQCAELRKEIRDLRREIR